MKHYLTIVLLFIYSFCNAQDCHGPIITQNYPEIIASYNVYRYQIDKKDSVLMLSVTYDSINKILKKHFIQEFCVGESMYKDPCIEIFHIDKYRNVVLDTLIGKFTFNKNYEDTLVGKEIGENNSCNSIYFYKDGEINYIENYLESKLEFTNYFLYDNSKRIIETKAITPNKTLFATVNYEYMPDGYKQTLKFFNKEKGKIVQENIWYIWEYILKDGKIIGTIYSNNEQVFERDEVLYDNAGRMIQRNIYENGEGNFIYKFFY